MKFRARTNNKKQLDVDWGLVNEYLGRWQPGTLLDIEITRRTPKRSDPQRTAYFSTVLPAFAKHLGYYSEEHLLLHRQLKIVFFQIKPDKKGIYRNVPHVFSDKSGLPADRKAAFCKWVLKKAAQEGCYIDVNGKELK